MIDIKAENDVLNLGFKTCRSSGFIRRMSRKYYKFTQSADESAATSGFNMLVYAKSLNRFHRSVNSTKLFFSRYLTHKNH